MVLMLLCSVSLSLFSNSLAAGRHTPLQLGKHRTPTFDLNRNVLEKRRHRWFPGSGAKRRDQCFGEHSAFRLKKIQRAFSSTSASSRRHSRLGVLWGPSSSREAVHRSITRCIAVPRPVFRFWPPAGTRPFQVQEFGMGLEEPQHRPAISDTSQVPKSLRISFCAIDLHWRQFIGISLGMQQPIKGRTFACSASRIQLATVMVASAQNKTRADLRQTNNTPLPVPPPSSACPSISLHPSPTVTSSAFPAVFNPTLKGRVSRFHLGSRHGHSIWLVNAPTNPRLKAKSLFSHPICRPLTQIPRTQRPTHAFFNHTPNTETSTLGTGRLCSHEEETARGEGQKNYRIFAP
ncbi:hypothetical protein C8R46DRAFT_1043668 [Mycena filopes]|nr:hypothetical protein C8R46DRAFT_1043668 [Mycena filopes]